MMENLCELWENFCNEGVQLEEQRTKIFKIQPVSPKVFFKEWLPPSLSDEQLKAVDSIFEITEEGLEWNKNYMEYLLFWGEGCIGEDTLVRDIKTKEVHSIKTWFKLKRGFHLVAYDMDKAEFKIVKSDVPYRAGKKANLYEVVVRRGKKCNRIVCTKEHSLYTSTGWKKLKDLKEGDLIATKNPGDAYLATLFKDERKGILGRPGELNGRYGKRATIQRRKNISKGLKQSEKYQNWLVSEERQLSIKRKAKLTSIRQRANPQGCIHAGSGRCKWETYNSPIAGKIKIQGSFEKRFANILDELGVRWERCSEWFKYVYENKPHNYQPDFIVYFNDNPTYYETKGYVREVDYVKLNAVREVGKHIVLVTKDILKEIEQTKVLPKNKTHLVFLPIESITYKKESSFYDFNIPKYHNYLLNGILHHNGGKDFTCSRILLYCAYWLMCMNSPQKYFGIAENEPIDIINVSINATHAKNVFFHKFSTAVQRVINPKTGNNWFTEQGMDLREGKDTQSTMIKFGNNVRAHSLHSEKYAGEGMNILLAVFDEVGEFKPQKAKDLYEALWHTETSRYGNKFKIFLISYMRDPFDFMSHRWEQTKDKSEKIYRSNKATWEVNPLKKKEDFKLAYEKNPEEASRRFENKNLAGSGNRFFKYQDRIRGYVNKNRVSPIADNIMYVDNLMNVSLHKWFLPYTTQELYILQKKKKHLMTPEECRRVTFLEAQHQYAKYYIHIDLAKANPDVGQDCAGFAMAHSYILNPIDEESDRGIYLDLAIQLRSQQELNFETIRTFIYKMQDKGFEIGKVTLDGYQSLDTTQLLKAKGIDSEVLSIDRTMEPYNTLKELIYTKKLDYYSYIILMRELEELINEKGKVDHPEISNRRANEEGTDKGSKDVADAVAGATFMALKEAPNTSAWFSVF